MAPWLIPALKAVLPHIGTIVSAAVPVFTKKSDAGTSGQAPTPQQIAELQVAAAQNATHIRELAAQLKEMVDALELAAAQAEARLRRAVWMSALAGAGAALVATIILMAFVVK